MHYEISDPLNTSYWDKRWQAHVVTEVDGTLQEEEERKGERKDTGKEKGRGGRRVGEEGRRGGGWKRKREEKRARYVCQCVVNEYR